MGSDYFNIAKGPFWERSAEQSEDWNYLLHGKLLPEHQGHTNWSRSIFVTGELEIRCSYSVSIGLKQPKHKCAGSEYSPRRTAQIFQIFQSGRKTQQLGWQSWIYPPGIWATRWSWRIGELPAQQRHQSLPQEPKNTLKVFWNWSGSGSFTSIYNWFNR